MLEALDFLEGLVFLEVLVILEALVFLDCLVLLGQVLCEDVLVDYGSGSCILVDVVTCCASGCCDVRGIFQEIIHDGGEVFCILNAFASSILHQSHSFCKALVVGSDDDGNTIDGSFGHVVDADTESTSHISHCGIAIDGRE